MGHLELLCVLTTLMNIVSMIVNPGGESRQIVLEVFLKSRFEDRSIGRQYSGFEVIESGDLLFCLTDTFILMNCNFCRVALSGTKLPDGMNFINDGVQKRKERIL